MGKSKGFIGFEPETVKKTVNSVNSATNNTLTVLSDGGAVGTFITHMKENWGSTEASNYFTGKVKPKIKSFNDAVQKTYVSVCKSVLSAAKAWAKDNEENISFPEREEKTYEFTCLDSYPTRLDEGVGMNCSTVKTSVAGWINTVKNQLLADADTMISAAKNSGFKGNEQGESLLKSLNSIKENMDKTFTKMSSYIKKTAEDKAGSTEDLSTEVASSFSGK